MDIKQILELADFYSKKASEARDAHGMIKSYMLGYSDGLRAAAGYLENLISSNVQREGIKMPDGITFHPQKIRESES